MATTTVENYIKHIYDIAERSQETVVPMGAIATALSVSAGTATTMVKSLAKDGLLTYVPRAGVELTEQGKSLALNVLRKHRLVEQFLVKVLDFDWAEVHEEAERLEHAISDRLLDRIDNYLGFPSCDPHGDPIPLANGGIEYAETALLSTCRAGEKVVIARVHDQNAEFLNYLSAARVKPGSRFEIKQLDPMAGFVELYSLDVELLDGNNTISMGLNVAEKISVTQS